MRRFSNFQEEYLVEQLLENVEGDANPFGGDELPPAPTKADLWNNGLRGASANSKPKYWKTFLTIVKEVESEDKTKFIVMDSSKSKIIAYVSLVYDLNIAKIQKMEDFLQTAVPPLTVNSPDKEIQLFFQGKGSQKVIDEEFPDQWLSDWGCKVEYHGGDLVIDSDRLSKIESEKVDLRWLNKSAIKGLAFTTLKFKTETGEVQIQGKATSSNLYTSLYEQMASISLLPQHDVKVKGIVDKNTSDKGKSLEDKELFDEVYEFLQDNQAEIGGGLSIGEDILAFYYGDVLDIIQGAWNFRKSADYKSFFTSGKVIHGNIDEYYKKFRKMKTTDGTQVTRPTLKENTADSVYMTYSGGLEAFSKLKLKEENSSTGEIGIYDGESKKGSLLQLSLKKSEGGAQGGKVLRSLSYFGFYDPSFRNDILGKMMVSLEHIDHEDLLFLQESLLRDIVALGKKGIEYAKKKITGMIKNVTNWAKSLISRYFSVKAMNKIHKSIEREIKKKYKLSESRLHESLTPMEFLSSTGTEVANFWSDFDKDYTEMVEAQMDLNNSIDGEGGFGIDVGPTVKNMMSIQGKEKLITQLNSGASDLRFLISNRTTFRTVKKMFEQIQSEGGVDRVGSMEFAIDAMSSLSDDIKMGESELPVIKLYGMDLGSSKKSWEVVSREASQKTMTKSIKLSKENHGNPIDLGFLYLDQESRGKGYLVTYLYLLSGVTTDEDMKPYYTRAQLTSDNKGYKAETSAGYFDRDRKKVDVEH